MEPRSQDLYAFTVELVHGDRDDEAKVAGYYSKNTINLHNNIKSEKSSQNMRLVVKLIVDLIMGKVKITK